MAFTISFRRRTVLRVAGAGLFFLIVHWAFSSPQSTDEIAHHNVIDRVTRGADRSLDVKKYSFLQSRQGRDDSSDLLSEYVDDGVQDFWTRFQLPFMASSQTSHIDTQAVRSAVEDLLALNGWVAAACPTLNRPFGQNRREDTFEDLTGPNRLYFIGIIIHSADHFLVDQLAVIVQLARRLGTQNIFVSMLDYDSQDSTPTLVDLSEAVLTLLGIPFRIRRVPPMTESEMAAYYPLEEAYTRNLALEPLHELKERRNLKFHKVIWLKGFTCPNDVLENLKVADVNHAALTCGMDWAENSGNFFFSDRWRTRDMDGDQFRLSRSSAIGTPPREEIAAKRYAAHLPFQVFCCESGTHIVDPHQTYYRGIAYRHSPQFYNASMTGLDGRPAKEKEWEKDGECMDSSQAWFCRDIWVDAAKSGIRVVDQPAARPPVLEAGAAARAANSKLKRADDDEDENVPAAAEVPPQVGDEKTDESDDAANPAPGGPLLPKKPSTKLDADANVGSDYDAMQGGSPPPLDDSEVAFDVPNSHFAPAKIIVNPRCVTTYAGVSHARLANSLFGPEEDDFAEADVSAYEKGRYVIEEWRAAPDSFVCQEQRQTGGRKAPKNQRSLAFSIHSELEAAGGVA